MFRPPLKTSEALAPFLAHVEAGRDEFPGERDAEAIEARLQEIGAWLRTSGGDTPSALFARDFRGGRLRATTSGTSDGPLVIARQSVDASPRQDARATLSDLRSLLGDARPTTTEFIVTSIADDGPERVVVDVRFDIVGEQRGGARVGHVGTWRMRWQRAGWLVREWVATAHTATRAATPLFREITGILIDPSSPVGRQFGVPLDAWSARLDSVLTRDSNGHHGVSVGDADGDGFEDLYVAQPSALPNRLLRNRGDGTFEDATERSGLGLLDDTAQSLFVDVDNDGDQDLVLATSVQPLLFVNDGRGRFAVREGAFVFAAQLQGVLTGVAMADYDRDGDLDAYLCVYSYFFGAGEDKAGTPMPYHDARNGPPGVLFRNDGQGRFVDVTAQVGLGEGNDRYHFAASWADVDQDGWQDLLVANDFGTKNLYRNLGPQQGGGVRFEDVAAKAGVLDHGAGMSAAFLDYDNDGRLDIYTGNMWAAPGQRVTAAASFMPEAPADVRGLYQRHARGNSLFRNRGDGTFEDRSVGSGITMGRWAWSSDALDVDSDGWQDLYVANGMLTRDGSRGDLESYFWRQVVARSPLTRMKGMPYDEAWRAMNQLLVHQSIASRQRNVLYRNDGRGAFDDVSGVTGLDLEQDGRSFAALDLDRDGDPDLAVMAARQAPHLRLFRNDHPARPVIALRLTGTTSNRDAVGARIDVEAGSLRVTRLVQAGSGFLSQHSREVLVGLGDNTRVTSLKVTWPSGATQTFTDLPVNTRFTLTEGATPVPSPITQARAATRDPRPATRESRSASLDPPSATRDPRAVAPDATWMFEPFPVPDFSATDLAGTTHTPRTLAGRPALLVFWQSEAGASRAAVQTLANQRGRLDAAGIVPLAIALDPAEAGARVRAAAPAGVPVVHATRDLAYTWAIVHRHLFMNRQAMPLPTALLLDASGRIVRTYRDRLDVPRIVGDAARVEATDEVRLARALPFTGFFHTPLSPRNWLPVGSELLDEGLETQAIVAFERAAQANPSAAVLYRLGTLLTRSGQAAPARQAFERALALDASLAEAHNDLGTLLAQAGDLPGATARFRQALAATPEYPDALNNLGYALLLQGQDAEARTLYTQALALQPDFPEALNNLGLIEGRAGNLAAAEQRFRAAIASRETYGEAVNNLALVLVATQRAPEAVTMLEAYLQRDPAFENGWVTLAKIHLAAGRTSEGLRAVEQLLQRNPTHPLGLALAREYRPR